MCHSSLNIFHYPIQLFSKIIFCLNLFGGSLLGSLYSLPSIILNSRTFFGLTLKPKRWQIWDLMKHFHIFQPNPQFFTPGNLQFTKYAHFKIYLVAFFFILIINGDITLTPSQPLGNYRKHFSANWQGKTWKFLKLSLLLKYFICSSYLTRGIQHRWKSVISFSRFSVSFYSSLVTLKWIYKTHGL